MPQKQNNPSDQVVFLSRRGREFTAVTYSLAGGFRPLPLSRQQAEDIYTAGKDWIMRRAGLVHDFWTVEFAAGNLLTAVGS